MFRAGHLECEICVSDCVSVRAQVAFSIPVRSYSLIPAAPYKAGGGVPPSLLACHVVRGLAHTQPRVSRLVGRRRDSSHGGKHIQTQGQRLDVSICFASPLPGNTHTHAWKSVEHTYIHTYTNCCKDPPLITALSCGFLFLSHT